MRWMLGLTVLIGLAAGNQIRAENPVPGPTSPAEPLLGSMVSVDSLIAPGNLGEFPSGPLLEENDPLCWNLSQRDPYTTSMWNVQLLSGFDARIGGESGQRFRSFPQVLRVGTMLSTPCKGSDCWWRGNCEGLLEFSGGPFINAGTGHLFGPAALLRYNFVQSWCLAVPYTQAGVGFQHASGNASANKQPYFDDEQCLFLRADLGVRLFISEQISIDAELGYRRIGYGDRSADAVGFSLGFTWFLGKH